MTISTITVATNNRLKQGANAAERGDLHAQGNLFRSLIANDKYLQTNINAASEARAGQVQTTVAMGNSTVITLGFQPKYVKVINITDNKTLEWCSASAGTGCLTVGSGTGATGSFIQQVATEGITVSSTGFKAGSNICAASKVLVYLALRNGP